LNELLAIYTSNNYCQILIDKYKPMSKEARDKAKEYKRLRNEYNEDF